jgi:hypothetical protein
MAHCSPDQTAAQIVGRIIELLGDEEVRREIDDPIDQAMESFRFESRQGSPVRSFHQAIAECVQHLYACGMRLRRNLDRREALAIAIAILERGYVGEQTSGYEAACLDALDPELNGIEHVVRQMAEIIKTSEREKHAAWVLATSLDPFDWQMKQRIAEFLLERLKSVLPPELASISDQRWGKNWDALLSLYVKLSGMP